MTGCRGQSRAGWERWHPATGGGRGRGSAQVVVDWETHSHQGLLQQVKIENIGFSLSEKRIRIAEREKKP